MAGAVKQQPVAAASLVGASVEKFLEQFLFKQFEARPRLAHGREVGRDFPSAVATKNLGKFAVASFESGQRSQGGTARVLEGIVCHGSVSTNLLEDQFGRAALHCRYNPGHCAASRASLTEVVVA